MNLDDAWRLGTQYMTDGWPIFPCWGIIPDGCACGNPRCTSPGKHPVTSLAPNGFKNASLDPDDLAMWLDLEPGMNIGIATGRVSGLAVLDIDPDKGGLESFAALLQRHYPDEKGNHERRDDAIPRCDLPVWTKGVQTGGGGMHLYYQCPADGIRNSAGSLGPGLDMRGDGGYVLAPPSVHLSGAMYEWDAGGPDVFLPLPGWMISRNEIDRTPLTANPLRRSPGRHAPRPPISEGGRNTKLTQIAGAIWGTGASVDQLMRELHEANREACRPPLPEMEVQAIARSVSRMPRQR
jgi:putative DNA primase/helicase